MMMMLLLMMMMMMLMMMVMVVRRVMIIDNHCRDLDYIVSAGNDGDINFWDARDGEWVQSFEVLVNNDILPADIQRKPISEAIAGAQETPLLSTKR